MDDGQRGDNINRMKVYRFESCPGYKSFFGDLGNIPYLCATKRDIL